jgi:diacylglycerol kinase (ATP)
VAELRKILFDVSSFLDCGIIDPVINMKKCTFIYNPKSGKQDFADKADYVIQRLIDADYVVESHQTNYQGEATELSRKACLDMVDLLVIAGGDGTFNECVNGLMHSHYRPQIGYIPAGTCCDIGNTLGLSKDVPTAVNAILNYKSVKMDIVKSNDRYFCYVSGNGAYIDISYVTDSNLKRKIGYLAYIIKGAEELMTIPKIRMRVTYDDGEFKGKFSLILLINSKRVAGINMIYKPTLDDGMINVVLYRYLFPFNNIIYFFSFFLPFWSTPLVKRFKTSKMKIVTSSRSKWNVDGESGGIGNQEIHVLKQAISIIVPDNIRKRFFRNQSE